MIDKIVNNSNNLLQRSINYIDKNFEKNITLKDVASHTYTSKCYLSNFFQKKTGIKMSRYINSLKVKKAKYLLVYSNYSLDYISYLCGFNTQNYFSYVFKNSESISPLKYRIKYKQ